MDKLQKEIAKKLHLVSNNLVVDYYGASPSPLETENKLLNESKAVWNGVGWRVRDVDFHNWTLTKLPTFVKVTGDFRCALNNLENLIGLPDVIGGDLDCWDNGLASLKGGPRIIGGSFSCKSNNLATLKFGPTEVKGYSYDCSRNKLKSLKYSPNRMNNGAFYCSNNKLKGLEGAPDFIKEDFDCSNNNIVSLDPGPIIVEGDYYCVDNPLESREIYTEVHGRIIFDDNEENEDFEGYA